MKTRLILILVFLVIFASSCATMERKPVTQAPESSAAGAPLLPPGFLDEKIQYLTTVLERRDISEKDKEIAADLLKTYQSVKEMSSERLTDAQYRRVVHTLFHSLSTLDEAHFTMATEVAKETEDQEEIDDYGQTISLFSDKRKEILDDYMSGNFKAVVSKCLGLKTVFGVDAITAEIGFVFAQSLARQKMFEEAINTGEEVIRQFQASADLILLKAGIAEWYLSLGQRQNALHILEKLTDNLDERRASLATLSDKIAKAPPDTVQTPPGTETDPGTDKGEQATPTRESLDALLTEIEMLIHNNEFNKAEFKLRQARIKTDDSTEIEEIDAALKKVRLAKDTYMKQIGVDGPSGDSELDRAKKLIEKRQYDEAIKKIERIEGTTGITTETRALKDQAIRMQIIKERNRAALLFRQGRKTRDPIKKEKYLQSSYNILKAIADKYPTSPSIARINSDMAIVSEELENIHKDGE
jgi:tetratricopeptide (TPR) repeat protein